MLIRTYKELKHLMMWSTINLKMKKMNQTWISKNPQLFKINPSQIAVKISNNKEDKINKQIN